MRTQMLNKKIKSGFTLIELMVFFIFISLIMAAATPIITKRVKSIPLKMNHGKFICYGGRYELYNSTRIIDSGAGCEFKPPRRAALYKIELVGAGAGGYSYTEPVTEDMVEGSGGYRMASGHYGDGYTELSDAQLWNAFSGASFTIVQSSGSGGWGKSVSRTYTGIDSPYISLPECFDTTQEYDGKCTRQVDDLNNPKKDKDGNVLKDDKGNIIYNKKDEEYDCKVKYNSDPTGKLKNCSYYSARRSDAYYNISHKSACGSYPGDWCSTLYSYVYDYAKSEAARVPGTLYNFGTNSTATGASGWGGSSTTLRLDGIIDFIDYTNNKRITAVQVKPYLRRLLSEYYTTGTVKYQGSCDGWGYNEINDHTGKFDSKNVGLPDSSTHTKGTWGSDVMYYGAIKGWGSCVTNVGRATGGEGGEFWTDEWSYISGSSHSSRTDGRDAYGLSPSSGKLGGYCPYRVREASGSSKIPYVQTFTKLNQRYHAVGNGGGGASYKVAYVPSLSNDCVFSVASGGQAIDKSIANSQLTYLHNGLATTLSCNKGTLNLKADGGYYNKDITRKSYNGFDNIKSDGTPRSTAPYVTEGRAPGGSPFTSSDVFTKYNLTGGGFGAGGAGSSIVDECSKPWGEYWIWLAYNESEKYQRDHQNIEKTACNEATQVQYRVAHPGIGGIIIISW